MSMTLVRPIMYDGTLNVCVYLHSSANDMIRLEICLMLNANDEPCTRRDSLPTKHVHDIKNDTGMAMLPSLPREKRQESTVWRDAKESCCR